MSFKITWRIPNKSVAEKFQEAVQEKYGKINGAVGPELQRAMEYWLEHRIHDDNSIIKGNATNKAKIQSEQLTDYLTVHYPNGAKITKSVLQKAIINALGVSDRGTIAGKMILACASDDIQEDGHGKYIIFPERYVQAPEPEIIAGTLDIPEMVQSYLSNKEPGILILPEDIGEVGTIFQVPGKTYKIKKVVTGTLEQLVYDYFVSTDLKTDRELINLITQSYPDKEIASHIKGYAYFIDDLTASKEEILKTEAQEV